IAHSCALSGKWLSRTSRGSVLYKFLLIFSIGSSVAMDSLILTCFKCGAKSLLRKEQLGGDICCQQCGLQVLQHQKAGIDSHLQEELCSYCNSNVISDKNQ
uniref:Uncharacterized protein n=1 Tax=Strigamia maritima TaxID=126957 RepID=T1J766_STRMM